MNPMMRFIALFLLSFSMILSCGGGGGGGGGASDTAPPSWTSGYPAITAGSTGASGSVSISENGKVYYIIAEGSADTPSPADVKAGVNYGSVTVITSGNLSVTAAENKSFVVTGLTLNTAYKAFFAGEDLAGNLQTSAEVKSFTTSAAADTTPPSWKSGYPAVSVATADTIRVNAAINEGGKIYYLICPTSASAPTSAQVRSASSFGPQITSSGSKNVTADTPVEISITGLSSDTDYDIWLTAEDVETTPNLMASPVKIDQATTAIPLAVTGEDFSAADYVNGAHNVSSGIWSFAVYSKNATKIILEIYDSAYGENCAYQFDLSKNSGDNVWRTKIKNLPDKFYYAYRAWGPNWTFDASWTRGNSAAGFVSDCDSSGNRFNPNKVLYDPYAYELSHDKSSPAALGSENGEIYGTGAGTYTGTCTGSTAIARRNVDTGKFAPKAVAFKDATAANKISTPIAQKDAIIYEAHVKGLTKHSSSTTLQTILSGFSGFTDVQNVPAEYRGTYKGAGYMAGYLKDLGINTIELLPVHETDNDANPTNASGGNYWGYMTFGYFAPDRHYAYDKSAGGPTKEFKEMVNAFHSAGIEVYLDVVFNHTGESGHWGGDPTSADTLSFRGLDNSEYYCLCDDKAEFWETTGCGNNFRCDNAPVRQLIIDSLTYWIDSMGVDGFRFDLAPVLAREQSGSNWVFSSTASTITKIRDLGTAKNAEMIAEAWDCQWPGGYQVSNFAVETSSGAKDGWAEWNGIYRDSVRKFVKGDGFKITNYPALHTVMNGSYSLSDRDSAHNDHTHTGFNDQGGPQKSINFLDAHDGFTLMDLVSYSGKSNSGAWPFGTSDGGSNDNDSWDCGGDQALRRQQLRNLWTILYFSRGIPMTVYGDEFGRTQNGNNNAYNLDSVATWNNYSMINTDSPTAVSIEDDYPDCSYHNNFGTDANADSKNGLFTFVQKLIAVRNSNASTLKVDKYDIEYSTTNEGGSSYPANDAKCVRTWIKGSDTQFLLFMNSYYADVAGWTIPSPGPGKKWVRIIDTANWAESGTNDPAHPYNKTNAKDNIWDVTSSDAWSWYSDSGDYTGFGVSARSIAVFQMVAR